MAEQTGPVSSKLSIQAHQHAELLASSPSLISDCKQSSIRDSGNKAAAAVWAKVLAAKPDHPIQSPGPTRQKERTDSRKLSSDLYMRAVA